MHKIKILLKYIGKFKWYKNLKIIDGENVSLYIWIEYIKKREREIVCWISLTKKINDSNNTGYLL